MDAWLMDAYRVDDKIILWLKTEDGDMRVERSWRPSIYLEDSRESRQFIKAHNLDSIPEIKPTYTGDSKRIIAIPIPKLSQFERFVRWIEYGTKHQIPLYNADVTPEHSFLIKHGLVPSGGIRIEEDGMMPIHSSAIPLLKIVNIKLSIATKNSIEIDIDGKILKGVERDVLHAFKDIFNKLDPDIIIVDRAFTKIPLLMERLADHDIECNIHRWDPISLRSRGGKSFHSYGQVRYRDFAVRLHGRWLIDASSMVSEEAGIDGLIELCRLTGNLPQQAASRSFGASFQHSVMREMMRQGFLIPFKEKPLDPPITLLDMVKADRAGHTLDPLVGFHTDVAELDFCSMYPWIMYNHNISADTILSKDHPYKTIPGLSLRISQKRKGIVPRAIKPLLDARMKYKKSQDPLDTQKAKGLKWVLVTSYGYLRFREFKLGIGQSHMAVGAYARKTLIDTKDLAEQQGFQVIHGIIDSLYVKKEPDKGVITDSEVKELCDKIHMNTGIPISFEGIFKWIVFLPSVNDPNRPVPARYFGVFKDGTIKARGLEVRQRNPPKAVKDLQNKILDIMASCDTEDDIKAHVPRIMRVYRDTVRRLPRLSKEDLVCSIRIGKTDYKNDIPQQDILRIYRKKGIDIKPGQMARFIKCKKVVLAEDYQAQKNRPDIDYYKRLLARSIYIILQPFGVTRKDIDYSSEERQMRISDFSGSSTIQIRPPTDVSRVVPILYNSIPYQQIPTSMEG